VSSEEAGEEQLQLESLLYVDNAAMVTLIPDQLTPLPTIISQKLFTTMHDREQMLVSSPLKPSFFQLH
jgi:hypothetical protein